jgi:putative transposase
VIVAYMDAHKDRFGIEPICAVLAEHDMPIAPSTYHARTANPVSDAEWVDARRANDLLNVWRRNWVSTASTNVRRPLSRATRISP